MNYSNSSWSTNRSEYKLARANAILDTRCKQGRLVISNDSVWIQPSSLIKAQPQKHAAVLIATVTGVQVRRRIGLSNLTISLLDFQEIRADWINPQDVEQAVALLDKRPKFIPRGAMQEVVEHYLSQGFLINSRDGYGAQLTKTLEKNFAGSTASLRFSSRASIGNYNGQIREAVYHVYIRADGSVMERLVRT